jgi:predicted permease
VSFQVALALVLSIGAGLVARSAWSLGRTDPGFPVEGVLTFRVPFPFGEIQAAGAPGTTATPFYQELTHRLGALPGVEAAGWGSCAPLSSLCDSGGFAVRRPEDEPGAEAPAVSAVQASPGYRAALGVHLIAGRDLTADDHLGRTNRVLVSESLARRLWPDESPLERTLKPVAFGQAADPEPFTVVGVVSDVRFDNLRRDAGALAYLPVLTVDQANDISLATFVLRTSVPPLSVLAAVRRTVAELRPDIPVASAETMQTSLARETAAIRYSTLLVMLAAGVTVLLSVLGVYGVLAYVVSLRRPEFGVRLALGASGAQLRRMVLVQGMITAGAGAMAGLLAAAAASRLVRSLLFGVAPVDPATYALAATVLLVAAAGATWLPARRASRVHPAEALRGG